MIRWSTGPAWGGAEVMVATMDWKAIALPWHHIARLRLVRRLLSAPVGIVEAPAGYGKSVLASELSGALGSGCVWVALAPDDEDDAGPAVGPSLRAGPPGPGGVALPVPRRPRGSPRAAAARGG